MTFLLVTVRPVRIQAQYSSVGRAPDYIEIQGVGIKSRSGTSVIISHNPLQGYGFLGKVGWRWIIMS